MSYTNVNIYDTPNPTIYCKTACCNSTPWNCSHSGNGYAIKNPPIVTFGSVLYSIYLLCIALILMNLAVSLIIKKFILKEVSN